MNALAASVNRLVPRVRAIPVGFLPVVFAVTASVLLGVAVRMPGDIDEGFYATAAELVFKGRLLYRDVFYPQAPAFPYLLGLWMTAFGRTFVSARAFSALCTAGTATLIAHGIQRETRSRGAAILGVVFLVAHELTWQWCSTIRPYAVANLLTLAAILLVTRPEDESRALHDAGAGALAALAVACRALYLPVIPAVALAAALRSVHTRPTTRGLVAIAVVGVVAIRPGVTVAALVAAGLVAALAVFIDRGALRAVRNAALVALGASVVAGVVYFTLYRPAPEAFAFGNVGYHALRKAGGLIGDFNDNGRLLLAMFGVGPLSSFGAAGTQFAMLYLLAAAGIVHPNAPLRVGLFAVALLVGVANVKPNDIHEHYFTPMVPVIALAAGTTLGHLAASTRGASSQQRAALVGALVIAYVGIEVPAFYRRWHNAMFESWSFASWRAGSLDEAANEVRRASDAHPGFVLPGWPGSAMGFAERILPGFEDDFGRLVADKVAADQREQLHLRTHGDFGTAIDRHEASVVVVDRRFENGDRPWIMTRLREHGYVHWGRTVGTTDVFVLEE